MILLNNKNNSILKKYGKINCKILLSLIKKIMSNKNGILEYCFSNLNNYNDMPNIIRIVRRTQSLEKSYSYLNNIHSH